MIPYIYAFLFVTMFLILFWAGKKLNKNNIKIYSFPGIVAIMVYILNEGLRFGRGIDYNKYWEWYMETERGWETNLNYGYLLIQKFFIFFNLPFQSLVLFMSFMFIFASLLFMKSYKTIFYLAMPLWLFYTLFAAENMVRWYLAFSFILIGLYFLMNGHNHPRKKFFILCFIGCTIHYGITPIPFIFYILYYKRAPLISPAKAVILFAIISLLFESSFMLHFVNIVKYLSLVSDRFAGYGNNAEYWLTNNASGVDSTNIGIIDTLFCIFLALIGYNCSKEHGHNCIYAYNLFLIGFVFRGMSRQVELLARFDEIFYFFRSIVFACILKTILLYKIRYRFFVLSFSIFFLTIYFFRPLVNPFKNNPRKYLYVWNSNGETPNSMLQMYLMEKYKKNSQFVEKKERAKQFKK